MAAGLAQLDAAVKRIDAVCNVVVFERPAVGKINAQPDLISLFHRLHQAMRFLGQAAGVERENPDARKTPGDKVGQHHVLGAEAAGERRRRIRTLSARQHRICSRYFAIERHGLHRALFTE